MSYTGAGIAIPTGVTARARGVTARGWGRGIGSYAGGFGAALPSTTSADMTITQAEVDADAAVRAVIAASAAQRRSSIAAVRTFQGTYGHGLTVDGIYGPATRAALIAVTGRTDLPAVGSGGGSASVSSTAPSVTTETLPSDTSSGITADRPWLIPVAVVSAVVIVAGVVMMRRPVRANRRRRR